MATLFGFGCRACEIVGWPDFEACPECGAQTGIVEILDVNPEQLRDFRECPLDEWSEIQHPEGPNAYSQLVKP